MSNKNPNTQTNVDPRVVEDFGREWETFNHKKLDVQGLQNAFDQYFNIFPFDKINSNSVGFDMGCGTGRWAQVIAPKVQKLNCIDPSELALSQAKINLNQFSNCEFECSSVSDSELPKNSQDFGYCLGVLHHIPNTLDGIKACAEKLKVGAPFLLYLYYRFDNKPIWFKWVWQCSDILRRFICKLPFPLKLFISQLIAIFVYYPLSRTALLLEKLSFDILNFPLSDYRDKPFYFLRTDALDRFGTKLEKRFTKYEIKEMMLEAGFTKISFSRKTPFWVAVGIKS
jgi:ubiquinone/menaquinone biosynthesis C-methylase UbiE